MSLVNDLEAAEIMNSSHFTGEPHVVKRRVRSVLKEAGIKPHKKTNKEWLFFESDVRNIEWRSQLRKEKTLPSIKSQARSRGMDAFERVQQLTT